MVCPLGSRKFPGLQKDPRAIKPLLDTVTDEDPSNVEGSAESALLLLAKVPGVSADDFAAHLNDANQKIVMISAVCLVVMHDPRAVPRPDQIVGLDSDLTTRLQALKGLGRIGRSGSPSHAAANAD